MSLITRDTELQNKQKTKQQNWVTKVDHYGYWYTKQGLTSWDDITDLAECRNRVVYVPAYKKQGANQVLYDNRYKGWNKF